MYGDTVVPLPGAPTHDVLLWQELLAVPPVGP
jgi:hypothetical protein